MVVTFLKGFVVVIATGLLSIVAIGASLVQKSGRMYHTIGRTWAKLICRLYGIKVVVHGTEYIEPTKQYIYVSNHASMFDIPAVMAGIPDQIRIVLKRELTRIPVFGWCLALGPYVVIDRADPRDAMRSIEEAAARIRGGASVLLFAEGTRTLSGKLQSFKRGAFALAAKSGVPIIPVAINNTFRILPKGSLRVQPTDISVVLGKPIATLGINGKESEKKLMEDVHRAIENNYIDQS